MKILAAIVLTAWVLAIAQTVANRNKYDKEITPALATLVVVGSIALCIVELVE